MYGKDIFRAISKRTFEISHKISFPYIERDDFIQYWKFRSFRVHFGSRREEPAMQNGFS